MHLADLGSPRELKPAEILIETRYTGVTNGTERHALMAELNCGGSYPSKHGYQHVGVVAQAGSDVKSFQPGDWVFFGRYVGHRGWNIVDVSDPQGSHLCIRLPQSEDYRKYALLGVMGVGFRGIRRFDVKVGDKVWVAGLGPIGMFSAQGALACGAHVTVSDSNKDRLRIAESLGAHRALDISSANYWEELKGGAPYKVIVDACGVESFFQDVLDNRLLAHSGTIGAMAVRTKTVFTWGLLHSSESKIEVSCHFSNDDLQVMLQLMQQGLLQTEPIISHCVSIDESPNIYATMRDHPSELYGVIFDWTT